MDCYILGCVLPLNRTIYLRKDYKILGLNINERKTGNFFTERYIQVDFTSTHSASYR